MSDTCARTWRTPRQHARRRFAVRAAGSPLRRSSRAVAIVSMNHTRFERELNGIRIINKATRPGHRAGGQLSWRLKRWCICSLKVSIERHWIVCSKFTVWIGTLTLCHNLDKPNAGRGCRANRTACNATVDATRSPTLSPLPPLAPCWTQLIEIGMKLISLMAVQI